MKGFFKPTKAKVCIAFLVPLFVAIEVVPVEGGTTYDFALTVSPYIVFIFSLITLWTKSDSVIADFQSATLSQKLQAVLLELFLPLLIGYLISCCIVYLFQEIRRRMGAAGEAAKPTKAA
ncbi:MAG: hypothetical protein WC505_01100 [Patescibacteria group bacterium]